MSVMRAGRTRYSTPKVITSQDGDRSPLDRGSTRLRGRTGGPRDPVRHPRTKAGRRDATDRYCIRVASAYDTASFRRSPARRPRPVCVASVTHRCTPHRRSKGGHVARARRMGGAGCLRNPGPAWGRVPRSTVVPVGTGRSGHPGGECMNKRKIGTLAAIAMLAFAACSGGGGGGGSKGEIEIWSSLPRQGSSKAQTDTIVN